MTTKIKYIARAVRWFDRVNGNTYHSVHITRTEDGADLYCAYRYGYGDDYRHTALNAMVNAGWLPKRYDDTNYYMYERENNYPIYWDVVDGLKRDCVANGRG